jgi:DNA-binding NtrC family response regulator
MGNGPNSGLGDLSLQDLEREARLRHGGRPLRLREWVGLAEAWRIAHALREARGNRTAAARALGIGRRTLYSKMEKLGLTPVWMVGENGRAREPAAFALSPKERT